MRLLSVAAICLALFLSSCGTGVPSPKTVNVTVTANKTTVAPGGTVDLTGSVQGFSGTMIGGWRVNESFVETGTACGYQLGKAVNLAANCKYGYLVYDMKANLSKQATYYAPSTPGTYHVTFGIFVIGDASYSDMFSKEGSIAIVVQ